MTPRRAWVGAPIPTQGREADPSVGSEASVLQRRSCIADGYWLCIQRECAKLYYMQEIITKYDKKQNRINAAYVLRAVYLWREKIGKKLASWNDVKAIRSLREKKA